MVKWLLSFASWLVKHCSLPRLVFKHRPWGPSTALLRSGPRAQLRVRPKGDWAQRRLLCQDPRLEQEDPRSNNNKKHDHVGWARQATNLFDFRNNPTPSSQSSGIAVCKGDV